VTDACDKAPSVTQTRATLTTAFQPRGRSTTMRVRHTAPFVALAVLALSAIVAAPASGSPTTTTTTTTTTPTTTTTLAKNAPGITPLAPICKTTTETEGLPIEPCFPPNNGNESQSTTGDQEIDGTLLSGPKVLVAGKCTIGTTYVQANFWCTPAFTLTLSVPATGKSIKAESAFTLLATGIPGTEDVTTPGSACTACTAKQLGNDVGPERLIDAEGTSYWCDSEYNTSPPSCKSWTTSDPQYVEGTPGHFSTLRVCAAGVGAIYYTDDTTGNFTACIQIQIRYGKGSAGNSVTGAIQYQYLSGNGYASGSPGSSVATSTPARDTEVEILGANQTSCLTKVLSKVFTDDTGVYASDPLPRGQTYFCAKILAKTEYSSVGASSRADPYASDPIGPEKLSTTGATTFSWKPSSGSDTLDQAMDINNAVVTGASWLKLYGRAPTFVTVVYPYPSSSGVSNFSSSGVAEINADDAFDWSVLLHEYGHYVATLLGMLNTTGVASADHLASWNMTNHENSKSEGIAIAWNEGFADFFSQMVQKAMNTLSLNLPDVGASPPVYIDQLKGKTVTLDLAAPGASSPYPSKGEDNEPSVARVLWDLYTQPTFSGSAGSVDFIKAIATPMVNNDVRNLSGAISSLEQTEHAAPWIPNLPSPPTNVSIPVGYNQGGAATTFGAILSDQNVAPTIMSALASSQGDSIEVNWRAGQPSDATDQSNLFLVQVWDPTWNTLLTEQVATRTGSQKGNRTYTATLSIPKSLISRVLHVVVLGWNSETNATHLTISNTFNGWKNFGYQPLTGPYISASVDVHV
jgi:hypothetical protein